MQNFGLCNTYATYSYIWHNNATSGAHEKSAGLLATYNLYEYVKLYVAGAQHFFHGLLMLYSLKFCYITLCSS